MLVYVDESYQAADVPNCKSTFAAVCINEAHYRAFDTDLFKLKRHFWKIQQPSDLELKGNLILSKRAIELPKNREFIRNLISLMKEYNIVPFALVQDGSLQLSAIKDDQLPQLYRAVISRVDQFMMDKHPEQQCATVFFDGIDHKTNQKIAISFNNFMFRHHTGVHCEHVLPVPNFSDSLVTPGIQLADVIAYCVNERYVQAPRQDAHLEEFFSGFRELTYNYQTSDDRTVWGFRRLPGGPWPYSVPETEEEGAEPEAEQPVANPRTTLIGLGGKDEEKG